MQIPILQRDIRVESGKTHFLISGTVARSRALQAPTRLHLPYSLFSLETDTLSFILLPWRSLSFDIHTRREKCLDRFLRFDEHRASLYRHFLISRWLPKTNKNEEEKGLQGISMNWETMSSLRFYKTRLIFYRLLIVYPVSFSHRY